MSDFQKLQGSLSPLVKQAFFAPTVPAAFPIGTPLASDNTPAIADLLQVPKCQLIGLAIQPGTVGAPCQIMTSGVLTLSRGTWGGILADQGLIAPGTTYYLSQTQAGKISAAAIYQAGSPNPNLKILKIGTTSEFDTVAAAQDPSFPISMIVDIEDLTPSIPFSMTSDPLFVCGDSSPIAPGSPVYVKAADGLLYNAKADSIADASVAGLSRAAATLDSIASFFTGGELTLTTAEWDAIAGTSGGLVRGSYYYLSAATAGHITATPPANFTIRVGLALRTTTLLVMLGDLMNTSP